tara:strand:- start:197 stop:343 length:147 start_codon:yes stop_codon:yes gene_type:complete
MGVTIDQAMEERRNYELLASIRQAKRARNKAARRAFFSYLKQLFGRDK